MPYADPEKQRAAVREAVRRHRVKRRRAARAAEATVLQPAAEVGNAAADPESLEGLAERAETLARTLALAAKVCRIYAGLPPRKALDRDRERVRTRTSALLAAVEPERLAASRHSAAIVELVIPAERHARSVPSDATLEERSREGRQMHADAFETAMAGARAFMKR